MGAQANVFSGPVLGARADRATAAAWQARENEAARRRAEVPAEVARRAVVLAVVVRGMATETALSHLALSQLSATGEAVAPGMGVQRVLIDDTAEKLRALTDAVREERRAIAERRRVLSPERLREAQQLLDQGRDEVGLLR